MAKQSKSPKKKYLVKEEDGIYTVFDEFFDDIENREEALVIALRTLGEIHITLQNEADGDKRPFYCGNMKVTTGLQRCLDELERRWPYLMVEMRSVPRKINGLTINIC